jgi:hypothetical protein
MLVEYNKMSFERTSLSILFSQRGSSMVHAMVRCAGCLQLLLYHCKSPAAMQLGMCRTMIAQLCLSCCLLKTRCTLAARTAVTALISCMAYCPG